MEILRHHRKVIRSSLAGLVMLGAGCASTQEFSGQIFLCEDPRDMMELATLDSRQPSYESHRDPRILAERQLAEISALEEQDPAQYNQIRDSVQIGLSEVACRGLDGNIYITPTGIEVGQHIPGQN